MCKRSILWVELALVQKTRSTRLVDSRFQELIRELERKVEHASSKKHGTLAKEKASPSIPKNQNSYVQLHGNAIRFAILRNGNKRQRLKRLNSGMKRIKLDIKEISEEQLEMKERQIELREKFEAIDLQCEQLQKETKLIIQESGRTQIRLALMFQILKARENMEFDKAAMLTAALREVIAREEQEMNGSGR